MANQKMNQAARGGLMGRLRGNMGQQKQAGGLDEQKSQELVGQAVKGAPTDGGGAPPPPRAQRSTGFDADAFSRQMSDVGTAQGTREAQASQSPADGQAPPRERRRMAMRGRMGR